MKTILVDARKVFITAEWVNQDLKSFLDSLENPKIILTNANEEERTKIWIINMPYDVFSLSHNPDKTNPIYYQKMLEKYWLKADEVVYFESNPDAVKTAKSLWINTYRYDIIEKKDIEWIKKFINNNI